MIPQFNQYYLLLTNIMRQNITSMNFRTLPSTIPLHSPSPDNKSPSCLTPTISPNTLQIKKSLTPIRQMYATKQNMSKISRNDTNTKQQISGQAYKNYEHLLNEKDDLIKNLKNMINMITDNNHHRETIKDGDDELKNEVKVLTIENQKLVAIVERLQRENEDLKVYDKQKTEKSKDINQENWEEEMTLKFQNYEKEIQILNDTMRKKEEKFQKEILDLRKQNKGLNFQITSVSTQKKQLQTENSRLMRILKEKNQCNSRIQNLISSGVSEESQSSKNHRSHERLSLLKIKEQYNENLRALKEEMSKSIQQTFEAINISFDGVHRKVNQMSDKLSNMQNKVAYSLIKESEFVQPRSKAKSEIYIEEAPESSSSREIIEKQVQSRAQHTDHKTKNEYEQQILSLKTELEQIRFKYDKICMDTSSVAFSQRNTVTHRGENEYEELEDKYLSGVKQLQNKQKQIDILYEQIRSIQTQNQQKLSYYASQEQQLLKYKKLLADTEEQITQYKNQIGSIKSQSCEQLELVKQDTSEKVRAQTEEQIKQLINNYEKQSELMSKQLTKNNQTIDELSQKISSMTESCMKKEAQTEELSRRLEEIKKKLIESELQYSQSIQEMNGRLVSLLSSKENMEQENSNQLQENKLLNSQLLQKQKENSEIMVELESMRNNTQAIKEEYESRTAQLCGQNTLLQNRIKAIESQHRQLHFTTMKQMVTNLYPHSSTPLLTSQNKSSLQTKQTQLQNLKVQIRNKSLQILNLQSELQSSQKLVKFYENEVQETKVVLQDLSQQFAEYKLSQELERQNQIGILEEKKKILMDEIIRMEKIHNSIDVNSFEEKHEELYGDNLIEFVESEKQVLNNKSQAQNSIIDSLKQDIQKSQNSDILDMEETQQQEREGKTSNPNQQDQ